MRLAWQPSNWRGLKGHQNTFSKWCVIDSDANQIRKLDWNGVIEGATVIQPEYSIIVNSTSKQEINPAMQTQEITVGIKAINDIKVTRTVLLRKRAWNPDAPIHSIVIFMKFPKQADDCIFHGINIRGRYYIAERYTSQCQLRQYFNCQAYRYKGGTYRKKLVCRKCA